MCFNLRNAICKLPALRGATKQVLAEIGDTIPKGQDTCFPSKRAIAENLGLSSRTVQRHVRKLEELKYIRTEERHRTDGSTASNLYFVDVDKILEETTYKKQKPAATPVNKGETTCLGGGDNLSTGGDTVSSGGGSTDSALNDHINDHTNTPVVPVDGDGSDKPLPVTKNPRHHDYKLSEDEKQEIQSAWNQVANGRFTESMVFKSEMDRNLRSSYKLYKKYQRQGHFGDKVRTKVEFAKLLIANFAKSDNDWCDRNNPDRNKAFVANLSWLLRAKTFEGMVQ